jgi:hypothetical protein
MQQSCTHNRDYVGIIEEMYSMYVCITSIVIYYTTDICGHVWNSDVCVCVCDRLGLER